jgi:hypothetical protein
MTPVPAPAALPTEVTVVNVGLPLFADAVRAQGRPVEQLDWRIPANGDPQLLAALTVLLGREAGAGRRGQRRGLPPARHRCAVWTSVATAVDVLPDVGPRTLLHCGPGHRVAGRGRPAAPLDARRDGGRGLGRRRRRGGRAAAGRRRPARPANQHATVRPDGHRARPVDAGRGRGQRGRRHPAYSAINQGPGDVAWFGRETDAAIARLRFLRDVAGPLLATAVAQAGPVDVLGLAAQGWPWATTSTCAPRPAPTCSSGTCSRSWSRRIGPRPWSSPASSPPTTCSSSTSRWRPRSR